MLGLVIGLDAAAVPFIHIVSTIAQRVTMTTQMKTQSRIAHIA